MFIAKTVVTIRCNRLFPLINRMLSFQRHVKFFPNKTIDPFQARLFLPLKGPEGL